MPNIDIATLKCPSLRYTAKLSNEADVDKYLADIKRKLMQLLSEHDM